MGRALLRMCLVQALAMLGTAVYVLVRLFGHDIHNRALLAVVVAFAFGAAVLLALGERGLEAGARWPLTPLLLLELLAALVAVDLVDARLYGYAALVGLPAVAALAGLAGPVLRRGRTPRAPG